MATLGHAAGGSLVAGALPRITAAESAISDLIIKLVPILHVDDPDAERRFYERLGLRTTYEGPEYPGFIAVATTPWNSGLAAAPAPIRHHRA